MEGDPEIGPTGDCPANLSIAGNLNGVRFYEAVVINATTPQTGGSGMQVFLRRPNYVNMGVGFRAMLPPGTIQGPDRAAIGGAYLILGMPDRYMEGCPVQQLACHTKRWRNTALL